MSTPTTPQSGLVWRLQNAGLVPPPPREGARTRTQIVAIRAIQPFPVAPSMTDGSKIAPVISDFSSLNRLIAGIQTLSVGAETKPKEDRER